MEFKWLMIMVAALGIGLAVEETVSSYFKAQVKIACYEAAKTNSDVRCDGEKPK